MNLSDRSVTGPGSCDGQGPLWRLSRRTSSWAHLKGVRVWGSPLNFAIEGFLKGGFSGISRGPFTTPPGPSGVPGSRATASRRRSSLACPGRGAPPGRGSGSAPAVPAAPTRGEGPGDGPPKLRRAAVARRMDIGGGASLLDLNVLGRSGAVRGSCLVADARRESRVRGQRVGVTVRVRRPASRRRDAGHADRKVPDHWSRRWPTPDARDAACVAI
jgi:hypothetical protein